MSSELPPPANVPSAVAKKRAGAKKGVTKLIIIGTSLAVAAGAVVAARAYVRPAPKPELPAPGITVGTSDVSLTNDAPQWDFVKVGKPTAATKRFTSSIPSRIVFDESRTSRVGTPLGGRVAQVLVERGANVKAGQALFIVASPNLAELRAEHAKALVDRDTVRMNFERVKSLVEAKSIPGKELVQAEQELKSADVTVRLTVAKLSAVRVGGSGDGSFTVVSPRDGIVVDRDISQGQQVRSDADHPLMTVADLGAVWVIADVFEQDIGSIEAGAEANVYIGGPDGTKVIGKVDQISSVVDADRHTVAVRIRLANVGGTMRPNTYAETKVVMPMTNGVDVPASAVVADGKASYIYVQDRPGHFVKRQVKVGSVQDGTVPVYAGVTASDTVVTDGAVLLDNQISLND